MTKYEIMYILNSTLDEETRKATVESLNKILTDNGATVTDVNEWGNRELAYEINKCTTGYYFLYVVEAEAATVKEFDRIVRINESLLRHLIVRVED